MHRNTLWLIFAVLCFYFSLVFCAETTALQESESKQTNGLLTSEVAALREEARLRKRYHHHLYSWWGLYGLAVAYLIKVKVAVVAFFLGSAVFMGFRYLWPHKCAGGEIYKEGSIVLDHPPSFAHHDHVPYSLDNDHYHDNSYDSGSFTSSGPYEPYSGYSSQSYTEPEGTFSSASFTSAGSAPEAGTGHFRSKRSEPADSQAKEDVVGSLENLARQMVVKEEQIGEFMLNFLGLDTSACRRRFICEMEFKSRSNSLTAMAFRVIGRSIFAQYTNNQNPLRKANSFEECAVVNEECVFIENNEETDHATDAIAEDQQQVETTDSKSEENERNLKAELASNSLRKRFRADRHLKLV